MAVAGSHGRLPSVAYHATLRGGDKEWCFSFGIILLFIVGANPTTSKAR